MPKKKPYYHNNWKEYRNAPAEWFEPLDYDEFMDWKVAGWELPSSCYCIIRVTDLETKKVKEHVYHHHKTAQKMVNKLLNMDGVEFTVVDPHTIKHLHPDLRHGDEEHV